MTSSPSSDALTPEASVTPELLAATTNHPHLSQMLVLLMAASTGLAVANLYYAQPLLHTIAQYFGLTTQAAGIIVTVSQVGYGLGLLLIVPLGDRFERRSLIALMAFLSSIGLFIAAMAQSFTMLLIGTVLSALFTVVTQILLPFAATLAHPEARGRVVGTIMSGLLLGILLARTVSGLLSSMGSWRLVYWVAAVVMLLLAALLYRTLPRYAGITTMSYPQLILSVLKLFREERVLRVRALLGGLIFAVFSVLWTSIAFLLASSPYHYSDGVIGLFGLIGAAGALAASGAGRFADRGHGPLVTSIGVVVLLASWGFLYWAGTSVIALIIGILLLDLAVQAIHVTNYNALFATRPEARNRLNSGYMTCYFLGGATGSLCSASAYQYAGWSGVVFMGSLFSLLALMVWWHAHLGQAKPVAG